MSSNYRIDKSLEDNLSFTGEPSGNIIARDVSLEQFEKQYSNQHCEWVQGYVIQMSPISLRHFIIVEYLKDIFSAYLALNPVGVMLGEPFTLTMKSVQARREPDIMFIGGVKLNDFENIISIDSADICIEVVSPESKGRDYGDKFVEYEAAGIQEYWIIDPLRQECRFHRLREDGKYHLTLLETGLYATPLLPKLELDVAIFWQDEFPNFFNIGKSIQQMLDD